MTLLSTRNAATAMISAATIMIGITVSAIVGMSNVMVVKLSCEDGGAVICSDEVV